MVSYTHPFNAGSAVYGHLTDPGDIPTSGEIGYLGYASAHILADDGAGGYNYEPEDWIVQLTADFDDSSLTGFFDADGTQMDLVDGQIGGQGVSAGLAGPGGIEGRMSGHFYGQEARAMGGTFDMTFTDGLVTGAWVAAPD